MLAPAGNYVVPASGAQRALQTSSATTHGGLVLFSCPSPLLLLLRTHAPSQLPFPAGWGRPSNLLLTWSTCGDGLQPWRHGLQRSLVVASNLGVALSLMYCDDLQPGKNHHNQPHGSITTTSSPGRTSQLPNLQQPLARPTLSSHTSTRVGPSPSRSIRAYTTSALGRCTTSSASPKSRTRCHHHPHAVPTSPSAAQSTNTNTAQPWSHLPPGLRPFKSSAKYSLKMLAASRESHN